MTDDELLAHVPALPGGANAATIAEAAGVSPMAARQALSRLARRRMVKTVVVRIPARVALVDEQSEQDLLLRGQVRVAHDADGHVEKRLVGGHWGPPRGRVDAALLAG